MLRKDLHALLGGGNAQSGITSVSGTTDVLLFATQSGELFGYSDGWDGPFFFYTGEGQVGDQQMNRGNAAVLHHKRKGRTLRLFSEVGETSTSAKIVKYEGAFEVDDDAPWARADALDRNKEIRSVIVFRLSPVGHVPAPRSRPAKPVPAAPAVQEVPLEEHAGDTFQTSGSEPTEAERREAKLVQSYRAWLEGAGHTVCRQKIKPEGLGVTIYTDLFDLTTMDLVEAKGSLSRQHIRMALGQLLDYGRFVKHVTRTVLLPERPADELIALLHAFEIDCVFPDKQLGFMRVSAPANRPAHA